MCRYFWIILLLSSSRSFSAPCAMAFGRFNPVKFDRRSLTDAEETLLARGFSRYYTNFFDSAVWIVELQKRWKKIKANPETTHIPYFAQQVNSHIKHIRKSINNSDLPDFEKYGKLRTLKVLEREAFSARKNHKVTSTWWNIFNIRLIALTTSPVESAFSLELSRDQLKSYQTVYKRLQEMRDSIVLGPYVQLMEKFPDAVLAPSISQVGPMAFNQTMSENIHFIGVSGTNVKVDGKVLSPQDYFKHDVEHTLSIEEYFTKQNPSFYSQLRREISSLPKDKREQLEFAYFLLLRERGPMIKSKDEIVFQRNLDRFLRDVLDWSLLPESIRNRNYKDREEYERVLTEYFKNMKNRYNSIVQKARISY